MDAPVYKKLVDIDNHIENPHSSKEGQLPVSLTENFWSRMSREGRPWSAYNQGAAVSNTLAFYQITVPSAGCRVYISTVMVSCTKDAYFYLNARHNIAGATTSGGSSTTVSHCIFAKAGTPVVVKFDGDLFIEDGGDFKIGCATVVTGETGNIYGSFSGIEVSMND